MSLHRNLAPVIAVLAVLTALVPARAQDAKGAALFNQRCKACHSVAAGGAGGVGPNLRGVVGRKASMAKFAYSPALTKSAWVWTPANLDKYLASPAKTVPGTKMVIGVADAAQRKAIIDWLATQR